MIMSPLPVSISKPSSSPTPPRMRRLPCKTTRLIRLIRTPLAIFHQPGHLHTSGAGMGGSGCVTGARPYTEALSRQGVHAQLSTNSAQFGLGSLATPPVISGAVTACYWQHALTVKCTLRMAHLATFGSHVNTRRLSGGKSGPRLCEVPIRGSESLFGMSRILTLIEPFVAPKPPPLLVIIHPSITPSPVHMYRVHGPASKSPPAPVTAASPLLSFSACLPACSPPPPPPATPLRRGRGGGWGGGHVLVQMTDT